MNQKTTWMVVGAGSAMLAASAVQSVLDAGWRAVTDDEPPADPMARGVSWRDALIWAAASAAAVAVAQMLARRGAAAGWKVATGGGPPK